MVGVAEKKNLFFGCDWGSTSSRARRLGWLQDVPIADWPTARIVPSCSLAGPRLLNGWS